MHSLGQREQIVVDAADAAAVDRVRLSLSQPIALDRPADDDVLQ